MKRTRIKEKKENKDILEYKSKMKIIQESKKKE